MQPEKIQRRRQKVLQGVEKEIQRPRVVPLIQEQNAEPEQDRRGNDGKEQGRDDRPLQLFLHLSTAFR